MKKIKKLWQNKIFQNYFILIVCFTLLELIFKIADKGSILDIANLRVFIGLNFLALLLGYLISFCNRLLTKIFMLFIIGLATIYGMAELGFHNFLGVYASVSTSSQLDAVLDYTKDFLRSFHLSYYVMLLPGILSFIYYIFIDKKVMLDMPKKKLNKKNVFKKLIPIPIIILIGILYRITLTIPFMQDKLSSETAYNLFKKPNVPSLIVNEFGYIGFGILDIKEFFLPGNEIIGNIDYNKNVEEKAENQVAIDNSLWNEIISKEENNNKNTINKYLYSVKPTTTNEYTGMFKGKNVIVIMIESGNEVLLNEEYYPNISKLYKEGFSWSNNYSPRTSCSTANAEFSGMSGLYTIYNNCTANIYKDNTYFESIFNLAKQNGYSTASFHDYTNFYYDRTIIHRNLGSDKFYDVDDLNLKYGPDYGIWASDEEFMESYLKIIDTYDKDKPFFNWLTTVTSHQSYTRPNKYNDMYADLFPKNIPLEVRRFMSKLKVVDNGVGVLVEGLKERGMLDDTVIVFYGDHYPYAIATDKLNTVLPYDSGIDMNADKVPFTIYNPSIKAKEFKEYTSYINVTPTLANLLGFKYDSRIYMGEDLLSEEYNSITIFSDGSWKNEIGYYSAPEATIKYFTDKKYSDEEILKINKEVNLKLKMSSMIIKEDYFSYLNNLLKNK